jgi:hypothetical protein
MFVSGQPLDHSKWSWFQTTGRGGWTSESFMVIQRLAQPHFHDSPQLMSDPGEVGHCQHAPTKSHVHCGILPRYLEISTCGLPFQEYALAKNHPKRGVYQKTPGFGVQMPDFTGLDQFHIPNMSDFKSIFLVQNNNSYLFQE